MLLCALPASSQAWHHPLYLGNDGYWRQRVRVDLTNNGDQAAAGVPVAVAIGAAEGQGDLVGAMAEAVRVVDASGTEMLFAICGPDGHMITRGALPAGGTLILPAECAAHSTATYCIYFDNPAAWAVPAFLESWVGVRNGGMETGAGGAPHGWAHDPGDFQHQASWTMEAPHSGSHCLKTVVTPGAQPTWISTRQQGIHIVPGAAYVVRAWVKASSVVGDVGWYVHVGNTANPMLINQVLTGGEGSYDWKELSFAFTAPAEADRANLGTVLYGTGEAWFDDVSLDCSSPPIVTAFASPPETLTLTELGDSSVWYDADPGDDIRWDYRMPVKAINVSDSAVTGTLVQADIGPVLTRFGSRLNRDSIRVADGGDPSASLRAGLVPSYQLGTSVCFRADMPARTAHTYFIYFSTDTSASPRGTVGYEGLLNSVYNLVQNPSFEADATMPLRLRSGQADGWPATAPPGGSVRCDSPGLFGPRAAAMAVPKDSELGWYGWHQDVAVQPGGSYLLSAWVKTHEVADGYVQLNAHYRTAAGELCRAKQYASAGPPLSGSNDWTLLAGVFEMPEDCVTFQLHLTMLAHGTVWHDGVIVAPVYPSVVGALQIRSGNAGSPLRPDAGQAEGPPPVLSVWPVNAIVKVFQDDPPPAEAPPARITAARNEQEPLQLAVRSDETIGEVRVEVVPPTNCRGARLTDIRVGVVGYVPIDHATGYFRSEAAAWRRKYPTDPGQSDGWAGRWPDPLLPRSTFALQPNTTQPIWITVSVPDWAPPGDYQGTVRFLTGAAVVKEMPLTVHVWDFQLPDECHLPAIYDVRLGGLWDTPNGTIEQENQAVREFMSAYRMCSDTIFPEPLFTYDHGEVTADFAAFDAAAERYFGELGFPHAYTPWFLYAFGWGMPPAAIFGEAPYEGEYPYPDADRSQLRPAYKQAYQAALHAYWEHMKARGWADKVALYLSDEPFASDPRIIAQMKALCDMIHDVDPSIPIFVSTWSYVPEWKDCIDVWGIGHYGIVSPEQMERIRADGDRLRYTTDGQMCTDTPYCAVERLLPHYCFHYDVEAYEFWGFTWLTYDPYDFGWHAYIHQTDQPGNSYYIRYPNGDGFLAYPGGPIGHSGPVSSIRLEQAREGMEDYEYLVLARGLLARERAADRDAVAYASDLQAALALAKGLVPIPNPGGLRSTQILPNPDQVFSVKEALAAAIESGLRMP